MFPREIVFLFSLSELPAQDPQLQLFLPWGIVACRRLLLLRPRARAPPREIIEAIFQRLVILSIEVIIALFYELAVSKVLNWP